MVKNRAILVNLFITVKMAFTVIKLYFTLGHLIIKSRNLSFQIFSGKGNNYNIIY